MRKTRCPGCGVVLAPVKGASHETMASSPACQALYGEVLAREYTDERYRVAHRLTVDAYAVQHPGRLSKQAIQSVAVHLIALHLALEAGHALAEVTRVLDAATRTRGFEWLEPPARKGELTIAHVAAAPSPAEHDTRVRAWAASAWQAWARHHPLVRAWAARALAEA